MTHKVRIDRYAASRARRAAQRDSNVRRFAQMLSEGWTVAAAARALGVSENTGTTYMRQIRDDLGPQAR